MSNGAIGKRALPWELIIVVALTLSSTTFSWIKLDERHRDERASAAHYERKAAIRDCLKSSDLPMQALCMSEARNAKYDTSTAQADLKAQQDMTKSAVAMLIVTTAGVYLIARTLRTSEHTLSQAKEGTEAAWEAVRVTQNATEEQARVSLKVADRQIEVARATEAAFLVPRGISECHQLGRRSFEIQFENIGRTSATQIRISQDFMLFRNLEQLRQKPTIRCFFLADDVVEPGEHWRRWVEFNTQYKGFYQDEDPTWLSIGGAVIWRDMFGVIRGHTFHYVCRYSAFGPLGQFQRTGFNHRLMEPTDAQTYVI